MKCVAECQERSTVPKRWNVLNTPKRWYVFIVASQVSACYLETLMSIREMVCGLLCACTLNILFTAKSSLIELSLARDSRFTDEIESWEVRGLNKRSFQSFSSPWCYANAWSLELLNWGLNLLSNLKYWDVLKQRFVEHCFRDQRNVVIARRGDPSVSLSHKVTCQKSEHQGNGRRPISEWCLCI